jgi:glycine cleavage system transcriptional repressor
MRTYLVLTATGLDRPGIVDTFTEPIVSHDGNVETSRMARLGGEFAMLLLVSVPEEEAKALIDEVKSLEGEGLVTLARATTTSEATRYEGHVAYDVSVRGADHAGIIHEVAHYLADRGVNIESMDTDVVDAPLSGAPLFRMSALVFAPRDLPLGAIRDALESIGGELGVDTEVRPHVSG